MRAPPPGVALHLVVRPDRADPGRILARLRDSLGAAGALHAYVVMGTHVHLLLTPGHPGGAGAVLAALGARAVDASPAYTRRYVLACMRYIELNPVRAGLVRDPAHYPWSSYRANALGEPDPLITPHALYCALGRDGEERRAAYRRSFRAGAAAAGAVRLRPESQNHATSAPRSAPRRAFIPRGRP